MTEQQTLTFEAALQRLKQIVEQLENADLPLEEMVRLYEEGKRLSEFCERKLREARERIQQLESTEDSAG